MEPGLDRRNAQPQGLTDLTVRDPFQVAQYDHGLLHRRKLIESLLDNTVQLLLFETEVELVPPIDHRPHLMVAILSKPGQIVVQVDLFGSLPLAKPGEGHIHGKAVEPCREG